MTPRIAAIDQGTTSTRVLVASGDGAFEIAASRRHANAYPQAGRVEQDGEELVANIAACLGEAGEVEAIAIANQGESCLAWDARTGEPLSPVIVWQDTRTAQRLAEMERDGFAGEVSHRAALPLDPYFSASKLGWILREIPRAADAHAAGRLRLGTTDAFFLDRLANTFVTDRATASRTSLMNIETGEWDPELCRLFGVPLECLPPIMPNVGAFGSVAGTPVTAAIVDQQAALYGHGCRKPGDLKITFGTGAFALAVTGSEVSREAQAAGLLPTVAWDLGEGLVYAIDGGVQDAGSAIEWALRAGLADNVTDLSDFSAAPAIERGLVFVPAFSGLGAPWWDRSASPLLIGLGPEMTRTDIAQALLEGIALMTVSVLDEIGKVCAAGSTIPIDGGLSKSPYFAQFLADCSGKAVTVDSFSERTAFGAAALAALSIGREIAPPASERKTYRPREGGGSWRRRFNEAIERCRGWR